ncbi:MAG: leucine-rich repeat protein [Ruminococcus sp.]|nr:leucine-rich repeat protein [Ruminococcus sp.]
MKNTKKIISLLLSVLMIITSVPLMAVNSFAATNGTTGDCTWTLDGTVLTISGNGEMEDYNGDKASPWGTSITKVVIKGGVTSIGEEAFRYCALLTSVTIPDSVTSIGFGAFSGCSSLKSIIIPDSVTSIGEAAFSGCTSLTSVTIPDSVTEIGWLVFVSCTSLTSITIPDSVTSIGAYAFVGSAYYNNESNWENGLLYIGNHLIKAKENVSGNVEISQGTKTIADNAFNGCTSLTSITIPDSVTSIGDFAFYHCTSLTSITIPDSATSIGVEALGYYTSNNVAGKKINGFTICGISGTAAEQYAKNNSFKFVDLREPESLTVSKAPAKTTYFVGDTLDTTGLELTLTYDNGDIGTVVSGFSIGGFDSSTAGTKVVTVNYKGKTATFNVEVVKPRITIANNSLSFDSIGSTKSITVTTTPSDQKIAWSSSNKNVATVSDGVVTAKGAGNATITATITVNGIEYSAECAVDVKLPTMSFPDTVSGDWYYDAVKYNFERGYITGYSNGTFGPANNIQRQDFALILARIAGVDLSVYDGQNGGFSDVPSNAYYSAAVAWAKDRGIVTGYSADNFGVGTYISREQICLILSRYFDGEATGDVDAIVQAYPDGGNTSPWAKAGVAWAIENGIVGNAGYINPIGNAGRAEVAQIIYNMANKGMI